jgi:hypothetical protein
VVLGRRGKERWENRESKIRLAQGGDECNGDFAQLRTNPTKFPFTDQPFSILIEAILDFRLLSHCPVSDGPPAVPDNGKVRMRFQVQEKYMDGQSKGLEMKVLSFLD